MIEVILIIYILTASFAANHVRKMIQQRGPSRSADLAYVIALIALAAGPLIWAKQSAEEPSTITVLLIGFAFILFPILASRIYLHKPTR